ncbi:MAG: capsule biosynthesis protein CapA [Pseudomonadota bacterium]
MTRHYLFLQGPHGPFFGQLASALADTGADVTRVGFTAGDRLFWPRRHRFCAFTGATAEWPSEFTKIIAEIGTTDLVLYGDTRAIHAQALVLARQAGLRLHVFEEGYLRPYWITYERGGANAHSRLMQIEMSEIDRFLDENHAEFPNPPASWGAMRAHIFYGAVYHFTVLALNRRYRALEPHRDISVAREAGLYLRLLLLAVPHWLDRVIATARVFRGSFPYHLVLCQLAHDASFRSHADFPDMGAFVETVVGGFARSAPGHHHLVFKAHPLEDGRFPLRATIRHCARAHDVAGRVHFVRGGKLGRLLDGAATAVTVNSTAAHQALWRGRPVKAFGRAIYAGRNFTSEQPLSEFWANPTPPNHAQYRRFRQFLLATSQVPGSYYTSVGRRKIIRRIVDLMRAETDPYDRAKRGKTATSRQLFSVVHTAN